MTPSGSIFGVPRGSPNQLKNGKNASRKASETRPFKKKSDGTAPEATFRNLTPIWDSGGGSGRPRGSIFGRFWMKFRTLFDTLGQPLFQKTTAFPPRKSVRICVACLILAEGLERQDCLPHACAEHSAQAYHTKEARRLGRSPSNPPRLARGSQRRDEPDARLSSWRTLRSFQPASLMQAEFLQHL